MPKGTILIVDDEERIRRMLKDFLTSCGYTILEARNGSEALDVFYEFNSKISLILLDVMMPKLDGIQTIKEIRNFSLTPVIMLTAKSEENDELLSLNLGADDYITKPFSPSILLARIETILKRLNSLQDRNVTFEHLELNLMSKSLKIDKKEITLTPKEFDLLLYLIQNKGQVLKRQTILDAVWNYNYDGDERTVDTHVKQLRNKIGKDYIKTVHRLGYRFRGE